MTGMLGKKTGQRKLDAGEVWIQRGWTEPDEEAEAGTQDRGWQIWQSRGVDYQKQGEVTLLRFFLNQCVYYQLSAVTWFLKQGIFKVALKSRFLSHL